MPRTSTKTNLRTTKTGRKYDPSYRRPKPDSPEAVANAQAMQRKRTHQLAQFKRKTAVLVQEGKSAYEIVEALMSTHTFGFPQSDPLEARLVAHQVVEMAFAGQPVEAVA